MTTVSGPTIPETAPAGGREAAAGAPGSARPAGFWRRALAVVVDLLLVWLLLQAGDLLAARLGRRELVARAFTLTWVLVVPGAYFVLLHGTTGQTVGKWLAGARVVRAAGGPVGYGRALARYAAAWLSAALIGAGFLLAAARRDRRALHDLLAGTRVLRAR